jgi:quercetin dioxygenase-like cupin family protein
MTRRADPRSAPASADVTLDAQLDLPPGINGKMLTGERLHIAVLRLSPGARLANYRHHNEQFAFVVEGALEAELEGELVTVNRRCLLHVPPGKRHTIAAPDGALIVLAQDKNGTSGGEAC